MKFSENLASGSQVVSYRWADMVKLIVTFHSFANRSNDSCFISNQGASSCLHVPTYSCNQDDCCLPYASCTFCMLCASSQCTKVMKMHMCHDA